ncbi:MAG: ATP-dependent Clp protease proteolytic subunit [Bacteroidota bacterium]
MIAKIYISGIIGKDTSLLDVMRQYKSFGNNPESVEVYIDSIGGSVQVGQDIFNYLRSLGKPVRTIAKKAYSIAAHIFMAGDDRVVEEGEGRIMIHMPVGTMQNGTSEDFAKMSKEIKRIEEEFISFYTAYIKEDENTVRRLLENETYLSGDEAWTLGFATILEVPFEMAAIAFTEPTEENESLTKNAIMNQAVQLIEALKRYVKGESIEAQEEETTEVEAEEAEESTEETTEVVALVLQDATGTSITFPDLPEDGTPSVGDRAEVDGQPASGEYVSPEGETWVFQDGQLTEVRPAEEEEGDGEEPNDEALDALLNSLFVKFKTDVEKSFKSQLDEVQAENTKLKEKLVALAKLTGSEEIVTVPTEEEEVVGETAISAVAKVLNEKK